MANPAARRLIRARDAAAFRDALIALAIEGSPLSIVRRAVIVPTHAAAALLRESIEARVHGDITATLLPALLTREDLLERLHEALPGRRRLLTRVEREVLFERAARRTAARQRIGGAPFRLRPGLIGGLLDFYDELQRRQRRIRRFARVLFDQLRVERGTDRGSESLMHQTAFMGLMFLAYERSVAAAGALDEHTLRRALLAAQPALPFDHLVVAVADHPADPRGLWPADFDLIGRLQGFTRVDVVVTDEAHDAGFRDRIERELPEIEEQRHAVSRAPAVLVGPIAGDASDHRPPCFLSRDREEELRDAARKIRDRALDGDHSALASVAIVCHRPLPYVYLARQVLSDAGVAYELSGGLPLAGEPYAAMVDLVMAVARTGGTRDAMAALLRCGLLEFDVAGARVELEDVSALAKALSGRRATGEADTYAAEVAAWFGEKSIRDRASRDRALRAAAAAAEVRSELAPYRTAATSSAKVRTVRDFIRRHETTAGADQETRARHQRARIAVLSLLDMLASAYASFDDHPREERQITAAIRHVIESRLSPSQHGQGGVRLVDAAAARFGEFDHLHIVGLVEADWPLRGRRSVFFTSGLLKALGWPQEPDELRAQQAAFRDLLGVAARSTTLHAFEREGEKVVEPLAAVRAVPRDGTTSEGSRDEGACSQKTDHVDVPKQEPCAVDVPAFPVPSFLSLRRVRPALADRRYSGFVSPRPPMAYRVSAVDGYVDCPFRYFAAAVLQLPEERDEAPGLGGLDRGMLVHDVLEQFYRRWDAEGSGTITPLTLPAARDLFIALAEEAIASLPETDRVLERVRLVGSIAARGLADRVFELEAVEGGRIVRRLVEYELSGPFEFPRTNGRPDTSIAIRGQADRIDVFADGRLRVVDYKLGRLPDLETSVQVAVYAHAARARLERAEHRPFVVGSAMYLALSGDRLLDGQIGDRGTAPEVTVRRRAAEFARHVEGIEAGEFPPRPRRPASCRWCCAAAVCRKEYDIEANDAPGL